MLVTGTVNVSSNLSKDFCSILLIVCRIGFNGLFQDFPNDVEVHNWSS